jgi:hypothetical protein
MIKAGLKLYRGGEGNRKWPLYYTYNVKGHSGENIAANYAKYSGGYVTKYETTRNLKLANMGKINVLKNLLTRMKDKKAFLNKTAWYNSLDNKTKNIINKHVGNNSKSLRETFFEGVPLNKNIKNLNKKNIKRNSLYTRNIPVALSICDLGYDGYIAPRLRKAPDGSSEFHQEVVLCNPISNKISELEKTLKKAPSPPRKKPRKRSPSVSPRSPMSGSPFGSPTKKRSPSVSPRSPMSGSPFGSPTKKRSPFGSPIRRGLQF